MKEVDRVGHIWALVQLARIRPQVRIIDQPTEVALEVPDVDRIEAGKGREQAPVRLGDAVAREIALTAEARLELVQRVEQRRDRLVLVLL